GICLLLCDLQTQLEPTVVQDHVERWQKALHLRGVHNQSSGELNSIESDEANIAFAEVAPNNSFNAKFWGIAIGSHVDYLDKVRKWYKTTVIELDSANDRTQSDGILEKSEDNCFTFSVIIPIVATHDFKVFLFAEKKIVLQPGIAASTALSATLSSAEAAAVQQYVDSSNSTRGKKKIEKNINNNNKQNDPLLLLELYCIILCILQIFSRVIQSFPEKSLSNSVKMLALSIALCFCFCGCQLSTKPTCWRFVVKGNGMVPHEILSRNVFKNSRFFECFSKKYD
ncbi:hypothetical protein RFI_38391, partial [Reticulomyxa filosa]